MKAFLHAYVMQGTVPDQNEDDDDDDRKSFCREDLCLEDELSQIIDEKDYLENCDYLNLYQ